MAPLEKKALGEVTALIDKAHRMLEPGSKGACGPAVVQLELEKARTWLEILVME